MPNERFDAVVPAPFGAVGVKTDGEAVTEIVYLPPDTPARSPTNALAARAAEQIERYLEDPRAGFDLPVKVDGTSFRRRVWREISAIPRGETRTYGDLAARLRSVPRAVGQACGDNALPLVIPCHRVVAANGLGGFAHHDAGYLVAAKRWLLAHEGARA
jgi:methylated-DNA-[protein]-cysteine S-methyltransferase